MLCGNCYCYGQNEVDSLKLQLSLSKAPIDRSGTYDAIAQIFYKSGEYDSAVFYYNEALKLIPNQEKELKGDAIIKIGKVYRKTEDIPKSVEYFHLANRVYSQGDVPAEKKADLLKDIGRSYYDQAQYDSAMIYYVQAKDIFESNEIVNEDYGVLLHYIGSVFKRQDKMDKACEYYDLEIAYGEKNNFPEIIAEGTYLKASCFEDDRDRLKQDLKALKMYQDLDDERMIALMYNNIAAAYIGMDMVDSAYYFQKLNLEYERRDGSKSHLSLSLSNMAGLLTQMKRYNEAEKLLREAEELAFQTDVKRFIQLSRVYNEWFELNYATGKYKSAVDYLELYHAYQDSAMDQQHLDAIHEMELAYETEKKEAEIAKLELANKQEQYDRELAEAEAQRQSANTKIFMAGGIVVTLLLIFAVYKWIESNKQKRIISRQKMQVEQQKELIEEKNKDIVDSMVYASSIQQAIITSEDYIAKMFPEFFVLYKPRDIVSGDFYWAYHTEDGKKLIAVGDCTGHGVPGAMMSMLGTAFLNEVVIEGQERDPEKILDKLRVMVKRALSHKGGKDGMDMSFCCIEGNKLKFAGANLPIYIIRNNELIEVKGDKQPVGYQPTPEEPFTSKEFDLQQEDKIYLFSDGYADQFGGPKGKKYKYKTFRDKLAVIASLTFSEQRLMIDSEFESWKGDLEQLDDVCVLGIRI